METLLLCVYAVQAILFFTLELISRIIISVAETIFPFLPALVRFIAHHTSSVPVRRFTGLFVKETPEEDPEMELDAFELTLSRGYPCEEHYVATPDGHILCLVRIPGGKGETPNPAKKKVPIIIMHGFLQSCEAWMIPKPRESLPYILADAGFDVWLGNNRGNKYSCKHRFIKSTDNKFWDFSLDQFIDDVPLLVDFILQTTNAPKLSYVGFSQGTAQMFGALSRFPELNKKVSLFVATAPATLVTKTMNPLVDAITQARPEVMYLVFGRREFLITAATFWSKVLSRDSFVRVIDASIKFLFGWKSTNISYARKLVLYAHIYSPSAVKCVVHWFQIVRNNRFQMYDDRMSSEAKGQIQCFKLPQYDTMNIKSPVAVFHGGQDFLPDTKGLIASLPKLAYEHCEAKYEHLDFMWADDAYINVFPKIVELLRKFNETDATSQSIPASQPDANVNVNVNEDTNIDEPENAVEGDGDSDELENDANEAEKDVEDDAEDDGEEVDDDAEDVEDDAEDVEDDAEDVEDDAEEGSENDSGVDVDPSDQ